MVYKCTPMAGARTTEAVHFTPVRSRRVFEDAVAQIADRIRSGEMQPGDFLPSERRLASQLSVSRRTLREAIKVLVQAGVLAVKSGAAGGTYVRSDAIPAGLIAQRTELRLSEVSDVLEARRLFEPQLAQVAALFAEPEDFAAMERTIVLQRQHAHDPARQLGFDTRFHILMARASRNMVAVEVMRSILEKIEIVREMALRGPDDPQTAVDIHVRTLAALRRRNLAEVGRVMDEHLAFLEQRWVAQGGRLRLSQLSESLFPPHRILRGATAVASSQDETQAAAASSTPDELPLAPREPLEGGA